MSDPVKDKKKWGGLGKMLHKDRPTSTSPSNTKDSTYGSEASQRDSYNGSAPSMTSSESSSKPPSAPTANNNPTGTKQVLNSDGHVVTTTTTTTTTTTSAGHSGGNAASNTAAPPRSSLANKVNPPVNSDTNEPVTGTGAGVPGIPQRSGQRQVPQPTAAPSIHDVRSNREYGNAYDSGPSGGTQAAEAGRHNFSYPSRPGGQGGTLQGIKAAAAGVHGAGETLRGTLNSAVDRYGNAPPEKVAAHNQVAASGRQEIESGRLNHQHAPSRYEQQGQQQQPELLPPQPAGMNPNNTGRGSTNPIKGILRKT